MFEVTSHGPWTRLRMAKSTAGRMVHDVSAYRIGELLVDTGPPATADRLAAWCLERGVRRVVLTHHHEDHSGGAAAVGGALGVEVEAPASAVPILAEGLRMPLYRKLVWGTPRRFRAAPLPEVVEADGYRFRVIPTPGHAFTHVCFFEEERRWLVSGDLWVHPRVRYLRRIEDVGEHLESLRRVLALAPELMLCAHAGVVEDARAALAAKIAWWEELRGRALALAARGLPTAAVARRLLGREGLFAWISLGDFSKRNLVAGLLRSEPDGDTERRETVPAPGLPSQRSD